MRTKLGKKALLFEVQLICCWKEKSKHVKDIKVLCPHAGVPDGYTVNNLIINYE